MLVFLHMDVARYGVIAALCAAGIAATATPVAAQTTEAHLLAGKEHQFAIPVGWSTFEKGGAVGFTPPMDKVHGAFDCRISATRGALAEDVLVHVKQLGDDEKTKNKKDWATVYDAQSFTWMGVEGGSVWLMGSPTEGAPQEVTVFVVVSANNLTYRFAASARFDDVQALAGELDQILGGVTFGKAGAGQKAARILIDDPLFGITVEGLDGWKVALQKAKVDGVLGGKVQVAVWVLQPSAPAATIQVSRTWADAKLKKKLKKAKTEQVKEDLAPYVSADKTDKKTKLRSRAYTLLREDHALVIDVSAPVDAWDEVVGKALPAFWGALTVATPAVLTHGKKTGADITLPHNVQIQLGKPWSLDEVTAAGAIFSYSSKEAGTIMAFARARRAEGEVVDPFNAQAAEFRKTCTEMVKGTVEELDITFKNAEEAKRYRCRDAKVGSVMILARGKGATPVHFMLVMYYSPGKSETPDGMAMEFMLHVAFPR